MNKTKHIYSAPLKLEVEYKYDNDYKKVYNIKKLKSEFKNITRLLSR